MQFEDAYARKFYYLRLSITDVCNFRCSYCLPNGYKPTNKNNQFLCLDELSRVVSAFAFCGTTKVRITGGEPTLRKDFTDVVAMIAEQQAIKKIAVTTNAYRLAKNAQAWRDAGLTHINVSLDSLDPKMFYQITGENKFHQVMQGIDAAFSAGFDKVKVNVVLMKDLNHLELPKFLAWIKNKPIQLRFIELMQTGEMNTLFNERHISGVSIRNHLIANGWLMRAKEANDGPAEVFYHPDHQGEIGLIMPYSKDFCLSCNRLRISALGKLHLCLFGEHAVDLRDYLQNDEQQAELISAIQQALGEKKQTHFLEQGNTGITPHLASIGG